MKRKRTASYQPLVKRKALVFEQALHRWQPWLDSIIQGRKLLRFIESHPPLQEMRNTAKKALDELAFPPCTFFELYWLCCIFADYEAKDCFKFDKLVLPDWFPFPFGFRMDGNLDFKGKRIYPPEVWDEADVKFWQESNPLTRITGKPSGGYCDKDFTIVLLPDHPVRKFIKPGRPIKVDKYGQTWLD